MTLRETHTIGAGTREVIVGPTVGVTLTRHGIRVAGVTEAAPEFAFTRLQPPMLHLLATLSGCGHVWLDGGWADCPPGRVYVAPRGVPHAYRAGDTDWRLCWLHLDTDALGGVLRPLSRPACWEADARPLAACIEGLAREAVGAAQALALGHWADLIALYAARAVAPPGPDERLRPLWEAVDGDLSFPWSVEALAARLGVSGEHLRRLCRRSLGVSPMRQVASLRMRRAAALLSSGAYTIEAVAPQVGYENPFAFSTAFKRCLGRPPSAYRADARRV